MIKTEMVTGYTNKEMLKFLRGYLKPGTKDKDYEKWIRQFPCIYFGMMQVQCSGREVCADHCYGGYQGIKSSGLLLVPSCLEHNNLAERFPQLHEAVIFDAILLRLKYDEEKLQ